MLSDALIGACVLPAAARESYTMTLKNTCPALALLALIAVLATPTHADETCLKRVFGSFCLGGTPSTELKPDENGEATIESSSGDITVRISNEQITEVSRALTPADWLNFTDMKVKLVRLYRTAEDTSDFPRYATSRSSKLNAIRSGRGYAGAFWQREGWSISLEWRELDTMHLRYTLDGDKADINPDTTNLEGL